MRRFGSGGAGKSATLGMRNDQDRIESGILMCMVRMAKEAGIGVIDESVFRGAARLGGALRVPTGEPS